MARSRLGENQIRDEDLLTEAEHLTVDHSTISGVPTNLLSLSDTPNSYDEGKFLKSTASGIEFATVSGSGSSSLQFYTGSYTGNDSTQAITAPDFEPKVVVIQAAGDNRAKSDGVVFIAVNGDDTGSDITAINSNGFTVASTANSFGVTYNYFCLA